MYQEIDVGELDVNLGDTLYYPVIRTNIVVPVTVLGIRILYKEIGCWETRELGKDPIYELRNNEGVWIPQTEKPVEAISVSQYSLRVDEPTWFDLVLGFDVFKTLKEALSMIHVSKEKNMARRLRQARNWQARFTATFWDEDSESFGQVTGKNRKYLLDTYIAACGPFKPKRAYVRHS